MTLIRDWRIRRAAAGVALLLLMPATVVAAAPPVEVDDPFEAMAHLVGDPPVILTPWVDRTAQSAGQVWKFRLTVDANGAVTQADPVFGPVARRGQALRLVQALKFRPFEQDGVPVPARFVWMLESSPRDYVGPAARTFPPTSDPSEVRIALRRTACFGTCPGYRVEIRGDGRVHYRGFHDVAEGEHHWRVPPAAVAQLIEQFRQAEYFKLAGDYFLDASDLPTYVTRLSLGGQHKTVLDYGGAEEARFVDPSGDSAPRVKMPALVTALEDAIDATAGTASWVKGDERTLARLRAAHWNFRSPAATRGLLHLIRACKVDLAVGFLQAGARVHIPGAGAKRDEALTAAPRCGSVQLIRALASHGALATRAQAQALLAAAAGSGYPELVQLALARGADPRKPSRDGDLPLLTAAREPSQDEDLKPDTAFDPAAVVKALLAAGAGTEARDADGATALHHASSAAIAQALLSAGADPNARDRQGRTPLFNEYAAEVKPLLIGAGADVGARDHQGRTALFRLGWPDVAVALLQGGADVNAQDHAGNTPLESAASEEVALVLLDAGATAPATPERRAALIERATAQQWKALWTRLTLAEPVTAPR